MDVLYYWKDVKADMKAGRTGRLRCGKDKLALLKAGSPDFIWVVRTPDGQKGSLQLLGQLLCLHDTPPRTAAEKAAEKAESWLYYDPDHARSVWFEDSGSDEAVAAVTDWVRRHFPDAVRGNFQGP